MNENMVFIGMNFELCWDVVGFEGFVSDNDWGKVFGFFVNVDDVVGVYLVGRNVDFFVID